jgi:hypothetical protein
MKTRRSWGLVAGTVLAALAPLHGANAGDYSGGYRGGDSWGYRGGPGSYWIDGYRGGYRGCLGCDAVSAAIVGLAISRIVVFAFAEASRPPAVTWSAPSLPYPPSSRCDSVVVDGVTYYNCDPGGVDRDDGRDW